MLTMWKRSFALVVILLLTLSTVPAASAQVPFVGMGDSIGEGVQSGDASEATQPFNFLNLIALRLGTSFPLPLIRTGIFGTVGDTSARSRINPNVAGLDLAVSGADVSSTAKSFTERFPMWAVSGFWSIETSCSVDSVPIWDCLRRFGQASLRCY
jgi:hypothetical protein